MKIRIIGSGIFGAKGEIPVGAEFSIKGVPPAAWAGKFQIVSGNPTPEAVPVVNPEPGPLDASIADLTEHLKTVTDADEVQRLIDAEKGGKSRTGALAVLDARLAELLA